MRDIARRLGKLEQRKPTIVLRWADEAEEQTPARPGERVIRLTWGDEGEPCATSHDD